MSNSPKTDSFGPDFLCIGMQKAGTGFLFDCLQNMEAFRLPLRKEIHHFDKHGSVHPGGPHLLKKVARRINLNATSPEEMRRAYQKLKVSWPFKKKVKLFGRAYVLDRMHVDFLRKFCVYVYGGVEDRAYLDLFTAYRESLTGDITPAYSTLDREVIERLHALMPGVKIILCVRDPVARLWSQLNMRLRRDFKLKHERLPEEADVDEFNKLLDSQPLEELLNQENFMSRSIATQVHQKWVEVFGEEQLLVINFEDLTRQTVPVLNKVSGFLGAAPQRNLIIPGNKKENSLKISLDDNRRASLVGVLGDEIEHYARVFDNHRDRIQK